MARSRWEKVLNPRPGDKVQNETGSVFMLMNIKGSNADVLPCDDLGDPIKGSLEDRVQMPLDSLKPWVLQPAVGMGVSFSCWTDVHPGTIRAIQKNGKEIVVQEDHAKRTDKNGLSESQTYEYSPNLDGEITVFTLRKNGVWRQKGESKHGYTCSLGHRRKYSDPSF